MKLLKIITSVLFILLCILCMASCSQSPISPSAMLTAGTPNNGDRTWISNNKDITLSYPHTWYLSSDQTGMATFISPLADKTADFREYISIGGETNYEDTSLEDIAQAAYEGAAAVFEKSKIEIISKEKTKLGQYDAMLYVFGGEIKDAELGPVGTFHWHQYTWLAGEVSYSLTLVTSAAMENEYLDVFNQIKDSLELA